MDYITIINRVMTKLRESNVALPTSSDYAGVVGQLVNEVKRECEDAWKWSFLRQTVSVTTAASTSQYALTGAGKRFRFADDDAYNLTQTYDLKRKAGKLVRRWAANNSTESYPLYFYVQGLDSNGDPYVNFYPTPDGVYQIDFDLIVPQDDLSSDTDELTIPEWPVILGAYARAVAERGEDQGNLSGEAFRAFHNALADAIAADEARVEDDADWNTE